MRYNAFTPMIDQAQPTSGLGRLIMGSAMVVMGYIALGLMFYATIHALTAPENWPSLRGEIESGSSPRGVLYLLGSFAMMIAALWVPLRLVHRRSLRAMFGPAPRVLRDFIRVTGAMTLLYIVVSLLPTPDIYAAVPNLDAATWRGFLPIAVPAILLQITAEELIFRGYLQSQLAARFRHPLVWLVLPSVVFGLLHYDAAGAGENAWLVVASVTLFGLVAADLTARSGTLGPAMALHFVTNISALLIAAPAQGLNGLALYVFPFAMDDAAAAGYWVPIDIMVILTGWLAARLMIRR